MEDSLQDVIARLNLHQQLFVESRFAFIHQHTLF